MNHSLRTLTILLTSTLFLASCGGTGTPVGPTPAPQPTPTPTPPAAAFIPQAGAAVGTGDGTTLGSVYVAPTSQEVELMHLVNEVRTKGTINGSDATAGSCVEGKFTPLKPVTFNGLYAFAARKHATYSSEVAYEGHVESQVASPYYYGATVRDRLVRAYKEQAGLTKSYAEGSTHNIRDGGENAQTGMSVVNADIALRRWMASPGHCSAVMHASITLMGAGHHKAPENTAENRWGNSWMLIVGWVGN